MRTLRGRYPKSLAVKMIEQAVIKDGNEYLQGGYLHRVWTLDSSAEGDILQDLVQILSTYPEFEDLTTDNCPSEDEEISGSSNSSTTETDGDEPPSWTSATREQIIDWRPANWWIPEQTDLDALAQFLPHPPQKTTSYNRSGIEQRKKYFFSAAAVAIRFIGQLAPTQRMWLRNIIIQEDRASVAAPSTHAQGLVSIC